MAAYLLRRILYAIPSVIGVLLFCFLLTRLSGDPTDLLLPPDATEQARADFRAAHGLDRPLWKQFVIFVGDIAQGNLGYSVRLSVPVANLLTERMGATVELAATTFLIAIIIGIPAGVVMAYARGSIAEVGIRTVIALGQSVPTFYLGVVSIFIFAVWLGWLPSAGRGGISNLILPAATLSVTMIALIARIARTCVLEVLRQDYIRTARAKGVSEFGVVCYHAFRNAILPLVTVLALQMGMLMGGVIVTETVFAWPGIGRLAIQAISGRDYPVVQGVVLFFAIVFIMLNLIADLLYVVLDPRIRIR